MYDTEILHNLKIHRPSVSSLIHIQIHVNHADITKNICYLLLFQERASVCGYDSYYYKYI